MEEKRAQIIKEVVHAVAGALPRWQASGKLVLVRGSHFMRTIADRQKEARETSCQKRETVEFCSNTNSLTV